MSKITEEEKAELRAAIRRIITLEGCNPDDVDIEAFINDPSKTIVLPNGKRFTGVRIPTPGGAVDTTYMRALAYLVGAMHTVSSDLIERAKKLSAIIDKEQQEDEAHTVMHDMLDIIATYGATAQSLMPCFAEKEQNAPTCSTVQ